MYQRDMFVFDWDGFNSESRHKCPVCKIGTFNALHLRYNPEHYYEEKEDVVERLEEVLQRYGK